MIGKSGAGAAVRKHSVTSANIGAMGCSRPKAKTSSHTQFSIFGLLGDSDSQINSMEVFGEDTALPPGVDEVPSRLNSDYEGMWADMGHYTNMRGLPRMDMQAFDGIEMSNAPRTTPTVESFAQQSGFHLDQLISPGTIVNPTQLHLGGSLPAAEAPLLGWQGNCQHPWIPEEFNIAWMRNWETQIPHQPDANVQVIDKSSPPSQLESGDTLDDYSESANTSRTCLPLSNNFQWL